MVDLTRVGLKDFSDVSNCLLNVCQFVLIQI